jgi:hypothetical protein
LRNRFAVMAKRFRNIWEIALKSDEILLVSCELCPSRPFWRIGTGFAADETRSEGCRPKHTHTENRS